MSCAVIAELTGDNTSMTSASSFQKQAPDLAPPLGAVLLMVTTATVGLPSQDRHKTGACGPASETESTTDGDSDVDSALEESGSSDGEREVVVPQNWRTVGRRLASAFSEELEEDMTAGAPWPSPCSSRGWQRASLRAGDAVREAMSNDLVSSAQRSQSGLWRSGQEISHAHVEADAIGLDMPSSPDSHRRTRFSTEWCPAESAPLGCEGECETLVPGNWRTVGSRLLRRFSDLDLDWDSEN